MNIRYTTFLCPSQIRRSKPEIRQTEGDPGKHASYRPICLLSSARKIFEQTIERHLRTECTSSIMQMSFKLNVVGEIAQSLTMYAMKEGCTWMAELDLTPALKM